VEKVVIATALQKTRWNKQETAKLLGIGRTTLYEKIRKYNLDQKS
jgi:two-component system NtrC family response regulator